MIRANSLLYAVYICLIVSVICAALLFYSGVFAQLNVYYNLREDVLLHNQSATNFALANLNHPDGIVPESNGIGSRYDVKQHGLIKILSVESYSAADTVQSHHIIEQSADSNAPGLYLASLSKPLSYSGDVTLIGDIKIPSGNITVKHITGNTNHLVAKGKFSDSESVLPALNDTFAKWAHHNYVTTTSLEEALISSDTLLLNSFANDTKVINIEGANLANKIIRGNYILFSTATITINKSTVLEDVILRAPKIIIEDGFKGTVQAIAGQSIEVGKMAELMYPSVLCVYNSSGNESKLLVNEDTKVSGAIVLAGVDVKNIENNNIVVSKNSVVSGDIYCEGILELYGSVYGSVYTNRMGTRTPSSYYENCVSNMEINITKRPASFIPIALFENTTQYARIKKVR